MNYDLRRDKVIWACLAIAAAGLALIFAPAPPRTIAPFPPTPAPTFGPATPVEAPKGLARVAPMFDLSDLPAVPPPVVPPPDPAVELKRFRFAGAALAGERRSALFDAGGDVRVLKTGDLLAGFALHQIDSDRTVFIKDGLEVVLPLAPP